jgi:hypothetical protein
VLRAVVGMSVEDPLDVRVDLEDDGNRLRAVVTERRELEVDELFQDGELRLWQDDDGWSGFTRDVVDSEVVYHKVNTNHREDSWIRRMRVGERAVRDAVRQHIRDPLAGEAGTFRRRCSPP